MLTSISVYFLLFNLQITEFHQNTTEVICKFVHIVCLFEQQEKGNFVIVKRRKENAQMKRSARQER